MTALTRTYEDSAANPLVSFPVRLSVYGDNTPLAYSLVAGGPLLRGVDLTTNASGQITVYPVTNQVPGFRLTVVTPKVAGQVGVPIYQEDSTTLAGIVNTGWLAATVLPAGLNPDEVLTDPNNLNRSTYVQPLAVDSRATTAVFSGVNAALGITAGPDTGPHSKQLGGPIP